MPMESLSLKNRKMIEQAAGVALVGLLVFFCLLVLKPFVSAILWAAILAFASWPVFEFVKRRLAGGNPLVAAGLMTLMATLVLVIPLWMLAASSLDVVAWGVGRFQDLRETGFPRLMAALQAHPFFSQYVEPVRTALEELFSDTARLTGWAANASKVAVAWLVQRGVSIGAGLFQIVFSLIFLFFFYLRGEAVADTGTALMERLAGPFMARLRQRMELTLNTVVRGTVGTAFAQAVAAAIGFTLFDVPNIPLFTAIVFVLGMLPLGPPLVWIPLGLWLLGNERIGAGIGLLLYGGVIISGIDNVVRPILIAGSWDFGVVWRRRRALALGAITGLLVGAGMAFAGLPWLIGVAVAAAVGLTPFASAGVVAFLGGSIWLFATGPLINGLWLFLFACGLLLASPFLVSAVRRWVPETVAGASDRVRRTEEGVPFAIMVIGVAGGMIAFGFIGLFLGPVLLALGYDLLRELALGAAGEAGGGEALERRKP
ncbi:MAG: AI-2E family transporter [Kiritimatiellae bacterium]|jgi:predicted PurR-regulated permease PerM|nr:AI-2E family transporter [Kiritimatiellia bacterium]NLD90772.1 AI-2E family transporter [Lentisphaerota bacterium]HPC18841.1 AI-2E family transporter [Kiritimatiellia bacterium]HQN79608.1 AI-2E family transporter [Kiritimatiellia bacterium]HQQ60249.1 AI-2E family transporter [Kiritimatiellia bacterium]